MNTAQSQTAFFDNVSAYILCMLRAYAGPQPRSTRFPFLLLPK
jgi:hypothetical protein